MGNSFDSLYYWKLQNPPNPDEKLMQALAYTRVAHSVSNYNLTIFPQIMISYCCSS